MPDAQAPAPLSPRRLKACSRLPHPPVGMNCSNSVTSKQSVEIAMALPSHKARNACDEIGATGSARVTGLLFFVCNIPIWYGAASPSILRAQRGSRRHACRCRWEKVKTPLAKQGHVELKCEFCNRAFRYDDAQVGRSCAAR